jgi:predicted transcriptional regulator
LLEGEYSESEKSEIDVKKEIADSLYNSDDLELNQNDVAEILGISQGAVSQAVS